MIQIISGVSRKCFLDIVWLMGLFLSMFYYTSYHNRMKYDILSGMRSEKNLTFTILSIIGICLVVAGHIKLYAFDWGGLFPYYAFHVALFVFISGYFYKSEDEEHIGRFILRKTKRLLLPYLVWNLIYGILATVLHWYGFSIGEKLTLKTLLVEPFLGGHQFMYNFAAWFVPALFMTQVSYVLVRRFLRLIHADYEWLIMALFLIMAILTVWLSIGGHVWGIYKTCGRILLMLAFYAMGRLYQARLEQIDTLPDVYYFGIILILQVVFGIFLGGTSYSMVWCTGFANGAFAPFITGVTGIAFYLRIARNLAKIPGDTKFLQVIGDHTFSIMMHHILVLFAWNSIWSCFSMAEFDRSSYLTDVNYIYLPGGYEACRWILFFACIFIPVGIGICTKQISVFVSAKVWKRDKE